jgi:hypothetical protein
MSFYRLHLHQQLHDPLLRIDANEATLVLCTPPPAADTSMRTGCKGSLQETRAMLLLDGCGRLGLATNQALLKPCSVIIL